MIVPRVVSGGEVRPPAKNTITKKGGLCRDAAVNPGVVIALYQVDFCGFPQPWRCTEWGDRHLYCAATCEGDIEQDGIIFFIVNSGHD